MEAEEVAGHVGIDDPSGPQQVQKFTPDPLDPCGICDSLTKHGRTRKVGEQLVMSVEVSNR